MIRTLHDAAALLAIRMLLLLVLLALACAGCTRTIVATREALPIDMTTCPPEPDLRGATTDADVAHGIADLKAAGRACRAHLAATRATLDAEH